MKSLRRLAPKQATAIVIQETAFVGGVSAKDEIAPLIREYAGDNAAVDYATAYFSGALGSILGHPANTALTRWQNGMVVESVSQSMLGAARKARGIGVLSMLFAIGNDTIKLIAERGEV